MGPCDQVGFSQDVQIPCFVLFPRTRGSIGWRPGWEKNTFQNNKSCWILHLFKLTVPLKGRAPPPGSIRFSILEIFSSLASWGGRWFCKETKWFLFENFHLLVEDLNLDFELDIFSEKIFPLSEGKLHWYQDKCKFSRENISRHKLRPVWDFDEKVQQCPLQPKPQRQTWQKHS